MRKRSVRIQKGQKHQKAYRCNREDRGFFTGQNILGLSAVPEENKRKTTKALRKNDRMWVSR